MNTWRTSKNEVHAPAFDLPDKFEVVCPDGSTWTVTRYVNKYMQAEALFTLTPSEGESN